MKVLSVSRILAAASVAVAVAASLVACSTDPERAKREYVKSGDRYVEQKQYSEAIVQYRNALQHDPLFGEAYLKLARAYEAIGDMPNAVPAFVRAADALPNDASAQLAAGQKLLQRGQFEEARARAERALKVDPKLAEAQVLLGNALSGLRDFEGAIKQLEDALALEPSGSPMVYANIGLVQAAQGNVPEAEAAFRKAIALKPDQATPHLALANLLWNTGRLPEAEKILNDVLARDKTNSMAHRALASLYVASRRAPQAEPHLKALVDLAPTNAQPKLALADYYVMTNRPGDAMEVLKDLTASGGAAGSGARTRVAALRFSQDGKAAGTQAVDAILANEPNNVPALLMKTRVLLSDGKLGEALKHAKKAAAADPQSLQAHYLTGLIQRARHQPDEAVTAFTEVVKINPRAAAAQAQLAELNLQAGRGPQALQYAGEAARQVPNSLQAQLTLVHSLVASGQLKQATDRMARIVKAAPDSAQVHAVAGTVALASNNLPGARRAYTKASELDPDQGEAFNGLVMLDLMEKRIAAARQRVDEQLSRRPKDSDVLVQAARVYNAAGEGARAEQFLRTAIEVNPAQLRAYGLLGQLYLGQKRLPEARATFESVLKEQPNSVPALTIVAVLYQMEGNRQEARRRYEHVIQIDPEAPVAANNLAYIYAEDGGNLDIALQLAQAAKRHLPNSPEVSDTLGWIYVKKDLATLAIPQLEQAVKAAPRSPNPHYHLGVAFAKAGEPEKGRRSLERALSLNLEPRAAEDARKLIEKL